jgi:hypothetical protein
MGLGPHKFAHGALEKVEHGGELSTKWNSPFAIFVNQKSLTLSKAKLTRTFLRMSNSTSLSETELCLQYLNKKFFIASFRLVPANK